MQIGLTITIEVREKSVNINLCNIVKEDKKKKKTVKNLPLQYHIITIHTIDHIIYLLLLLLVNIRLFVNIAHYYC